MLCFEKLEVEKLKKILRNLPPPLIYFLSVLVAVAIFKNYCVLVVPLLLRMHHYALRRESMVVAPFCSAHDGNVFGEDSLRRRFCYWFFGFEEVKPSECREGNRSR